MFFQARIGLPVSGFISGSGIVVRCQESRNYRSYIWVGGDNSFLSEECVTCILISRVYRYHVSNVVTTRWITVSKPFLNDKMRSLNVTVFVILNCENLFFY